MTFPSPEWPFWKKIHETAAALGHSLQSIAPRRKPPAPLANVPPIPPLDLPFPHDILAPIATLQIPDHFRKEISKCFFHRISELQEECSTTYKRAYHSYASLSATTSKLNALQQAYEALYRRRCLPIIQSQVTAVVHKVAKQQLLISQERKRPFNSEYIPLLETYFENNAYPSALDRRLLAQKSMMTPRQIEVWFQNHRNRAKKDGKILKRLADGPTKSILESLEKKMPHLVVPASERAHSVTIDNSDNSEDEDFDMNHESEHGNFCIDTSATYEDAPAFNRDLSRQPFIFPSVHWRREPASTPIPSHIVDMDEFINAFSSLNMREGASRKHRKLEANRRRPSPWFASRSTVPSRAPHPALIRTCPNTSYRLSTCSTVKPSTSCIDRYAWSASFGPCTQDSFSTRKVPDLSRRVPSTTPFNKYIPTSPTSPSSLSLSSVDSRTPSLSSVASSQSRSSSYSSISSQGEPKTPLLLPSQEIIFNQDDITTFEALEAFFQGSPAMLDDLLSENLAFDLPGHEFSKPTPITAPVVPSFSVPSYSALSYPAPAPACLDNLNTLLFIPDTNFLQVQF